MDVLEKFEKVLTFGGEDEDVVDKGCKAVIWLDTVEGTDKVEHTG